MLIEGWRFCWNRSLLSVVTKLRSKKHCYQTDGQRRSLIDPIPPAWHNSLTRFGPPCRTSSHIAVAVNVHHGKHPRGYGFSGPPVASPRICVNDIKKLSDCSATVRPTDGRVYRMSDSGTCGPSRQLFYLGYLVVMNGQISIGSNALAFSG
ncbi:hypothetical protein BDV59DRAFT_171757 [Aspergillus ambiguus]|uniref:uncharacterized protein n=1 Tax=Aspergillus ambiguus TaxID=176160 RepID=UPI003CCDF11D